MARTRLSRIPTWAVHTVITAFCGLSLTQASGEPTSPLQWPTDPEKQGCQNLLANVEQAFSDINAACIGMNESAERLKQCIHDNIVVCVEEARKAGNNFVFPEDDESDDSGGDRCKHIIDVSRKCEGGIYSVTPEEIAKNRKEVRGLRDDLRKEKQEARKNDMDNMKQNQDETNKIMDEENKNDQDWQKQRKELNDKLREMLKGIDADSMKTIKDMQDKLDQIDMEYIKYRDALRRKISMANDTELAWNTQCRAAANEVANQAEAELNKRIEAQMLVARNFRANTLAGKQRRDLKIKRRRITNKYNETLAKCLRGDAEPGASMKLKLSQMKNDVRDSQAEANDKAARLDKLRQQIENNVNTMAQTLNAERQQAIQSNQQDLALLDQAHNSNMQRLQQRKQQMWQNQWLDSVQRTQNQNELNQRFKDLSDDEAALTAEYKCWRKMSKEQTQSSLEQLAKARSAYGRMTTNCRYDAKTKKYVFQSLQCSASPAKANEYCGILGEAAGGPADSSSSGGSGGKGSALDAGAKTRSAP